MSRSARASSISRRGNAGLFFVLEPGMGPSRPGTNRWRIKPSLETFDVDAGDARPDGVQCLDPEIAWFICRSRTRCVSITNGTSVSLRWLLLLHCLDTDASIGQNARHRGHHAGLVDRGHAQIVAVSTSSIEATARSDSSPG